MENLTHAHNWIYWFFPPKCQHQYCAVWRTNNGEEIQKKKNKRTSSSSLLSNKTVDIKYTVKIFRQYWISRRQQNTTENICHRLANSMWNRKLSERKKKKSAYQKSCIRLFCYIFVVALISLAYLVSEFPSELFILCRSENSHIFIFLHFYFSFFSVVVAVLTSK